MNDMYLLGMMLVIVSIIGILLYNSFNGVHDSLTNAHIGTVYNFRYNQPLTGDYERYLAKVVSVRKLDNSDISRLNWTSDYRVYDKSFVRTNTLVTCQMPNGDYRQFYAERSDMCRRPLISGFLFKSGIVNMF